VRSDEQIDFRWQDQSPKDDFPKDNFSIRWTGKIKSDRTGNYEFIVRGDDGYRLYINNDLVIDNWKDQPATVRRATLTLEANREYDMKLEYYEHGGWAEIGFGWQQKVDLKESEAVKFAAQSDVTVACVGFNAETESEGFDRPFNLPEEQVALLNELTKVSKKVVVVLTAGGGVAMADWLPQVQGLLHAWYPGQEGGTALAEVLFGEVNPSGKLPATFEKGWEDNATFNSYYDPDGDKRVQYTEGIFAGYRHFDKNAIEPLFAFGYGLSYTDFEYGNLSVSPQQTKKGGKIKVTFDVKNTGARAGAEVAQLYVQDVAASVPRPEKELKAFAKVWLKPGEKKRIGLELDKSALAFYDAAKGAWVVEPGEFKVLVGSSSRLIRFSKNFMWR
jgi:beta-glucosidase